MLSSIARRGREALSEKARYIEQHMRSLYVPLGVHAVRQFPMPTLSSTDLVVVSLIRDAESQIESFITYYLELGSRHIVLLDNGSIDDTVRLAQRFDNVTILRTALSYKKHKRVLKKYLMDRFGGKSWCLLSDLDERFDYPGSGRVSLTEFLAYLNRGRYTAVMAHMLDMFSDRPASAWPDDRKESLSEHCRWYDVSSVVKVRYAEVKPLRSNRVSNDAIRVFKGGIRKSVFGIGASLTKHPLMFRPGGARLCLLNAHLCLRANIADVTCVLYHYPFDHAFLNKCRLAAERENYARESVAYKTYLKKLGAEPALTLKRSTARELRNVDQLVDDGFLVVSDAYRRMAAR